MNFGKFTPVIVLVFGLAACNKDPLESFPPELSQVKSSLEAAFESQDINLDASVARLSAIADDSARVRTELKGLFSNRPSYVLEYALVTPPGIMKIIEPPLYYPTQGTDISSQAHIIKLFNEKIPVLSETFLAVEGFYAVVDVHPVLKNNSVLGGLTTLFYPHELLDPIIDPLLDGKDFEIWMMEKGGTLIWDQDVPDIGRNLFTDPYYDSFTELKTALNKISSEEYGETTYSFYQAGTTVKVTKRAHWITFTHHGQEWKIVYVKIE